MPTVSGILKHLAQEGKLVARRGASDDDGQDPDEVLQTMPEPDLREAVLLEQSDGTQEIRLVEDGIVLTDGEPLYRVIGRSER